MLISENEVSVTEFDHQVANINLDSLRDAIPDSCESIRKQSWSELSRLCEPCMLEDPDAYRRCLEDRFRAYESAGDYEGLYNIWAMLVDVCVSHWPENKSLSGLLNRLKNIRSSFPMFPSLPTAANVKLAELAARMLVETNNQELTELADTCHYFMSQSNDTHYRKRAAHYLALFHLSSGNIERVNQLAEFSA